MDSDLARRAHALLNQAVDLAEPARRALIESACSGVPKLGDRVLALLAAMRRSGEFLETPALGARRPPAKQAGDVSLEIVGNYRIERVIGVGGMATVYEAIQDQPRRRENVAPRAAGRYG